MPEDEWSVSLSQLVNKEHPEKPRIDGRCTAELIRDVNIVLTTLHFSIQPKHSSILFLEGVSPQNHPVLNEWLGFTHELRNRVAGFKEEVRFLKETLISEADVPPARCKELRLAAAPESYSLNYPADRYVLAGLSEGLWNRLTEELKGKEMDEWWDKKEESAARQGIPKFELVDDSEEDDDEYDDDEPRVTWIETTSRLYTVNNMEQHIFVIPGVGEEHGKMTLHREQEEWQLARHEREMERLNEVIEQLAREQTELRQKIENEKSSRGMFVLDKQGRLMYVESGRWLTNTAWKTEEAKRKENPQQPGLGIKRAPQQPAPPPARPAVAGGLRPGEIPPQGPKISTGRAPPANKPVAPTTTTTTTAADPKPRSYSAFRPARLKIAPLVAFGTAAVGSQPQASAPAQQQQQQQQQQKEAGE